MERVKHLLLRAAGKEMRPNPEEETQLVRSDTSSSCDANSYQSEGEEGYSDHVIHNELSTNDDSVRHRKSNGDDGNAELGTRVKDTSPKLVRRDILSYIIIIMAAGCIVVAVGSAQSLDATVPYAELHAIRCALALLIGSPLLIKGRCQIAVERSAVPWLVLVCLVVYGAVLTLNISVNYVPLGNAICVYLAAEVVALVVASFINRDWNVPSLIASVVVIASVLLVTQPGMGEGMPQPVYTNDSIRGNCYSFCPDYNYNTQVHPFSNTSSKLSTSKQITSHNGQNNISSNITAALQSTSFYNTNNKELLGYILAAISGVLYGVMDIMFNRPVTGMQHIGLGFWLATGNVFFGVVQMLLTETPSLPVGCPFCMTMVFTHGFAVGLSSILWFLGMQLCTMPLLAVIVWAAVTIPVDFVVQYTLLSGMHPGHQNWMEYLGAVLCFVGLIIGPGYQVWYQRKSTEPKKSHSDDEA